MIIMTIREIANITNIPFSTVYRALKNPSSAKPEVLKKIDEFTSSEPNIFTLKQVYIIIPYINEFYTHFLLHITTLLSKKGIIVNSFIYHENEKLENDFIMSLTLSSRIGLIWIPTGNKNDYSFLSRKKNKVPLVSLLRQINDHSMDVQILQDNKQALDISLKYLISEGKKNILMINGHSTLTTAQLRNEYFIQLLDLYPHITGTTIEADYQDWKNSYKILTETPIDLSKYDAIITTSENLCYGTLKALNIQHIDKDKIPIICFDYTVGLESLGVSMIYFSPEQFAEKAFEMLFEKVKNPSYCVKYIIAPIVLYNK